MYKVNILFTEANGNLSDSREIIVDAVKTAEEYVFPKLKVNWDIDLLITNRLYDIIIPEEEPAAAAPVASDPNKMMTPDDIAKLLASMGI